MIQKNIFKQLSFENTLYNGDEMGEHKNIIDLINEKSVIKWLDEKKNDLN